MEGTTGKIWEGVSKTNSMNGWANIISYYILNLCKSIIQKVIICSLYSTLQYVFMHPKQDFKNLCSKNILKQESNRMIPNLSCLRSYQNVLEPSNTESKSLCTVGLVLMLCPIVSLPLTEYHLFIIGYVVTHVLYYGALATQ